jgi:hypothetical protein
MTSKGKVSINVLVIITNIVLSTIFIEFINGKADSKYTLHGLYNKTIKNVLCIYKIQFKSQQMDPVRLKLNMQIVQKTLFKKVSYQKFYPFVNRNLKFNSLHNIVVFKSIEEQTCLVLDFD